MNGHYHIIPILLLSLLLFACGNGRQANGDKMSEMEQMKYDNTLKKIESIYTRAGDAVASGDESAMSNIRDEIHHLKYDFDGENMGENARQKCQALKERIDALKQNPDAVFQDVNHDISATVSQELQDSKGILISRKNLKLSTAARFPYYLNAGDKLTLKLDCQGSMRASFYDINRQKCIRQWSVSSPMEDSVAVSAGGIYMLELAPVYSEATAGLTLSCTGTDKSHRRHVQEKTVKCRKGDFLALESDSVIVRNVFKEPKKIGLRGNLKSMFSGKSRVLVPVAVPTGCDALLYSLRISTNEKTVASDGKFADQLSVASSRVILFGENVYEKHTIVSSIIDRLLGSTRPPREEDAFCNMYVLTDAMQAKKFQDGTASSGNYKYDVNQSQMGTQSCNGQLLPNGHKTLYLGFENERMRYDNYIWLEVVALTYTKKYVRPVYRVR